MRAVAPPPTGRAKNDKRSVAITKRPVAYELHHGVL